MNLSDIELLEEALLTDEAGFSQPFVYDDGEINWPAIVQDRNARIKRLTHELHEAIDLCKELSKTITNLHLHINNLQRIITNLDP